MVSEARPANVVLPRLRPVAPDRALWDAVAVSGPGPLPRPLTSLIGREGDVAAAAKLLAGGARLLTLTGPGGVGKTRLALAIGEAVAATFPDGVAFVSLAAVSHPELVLPTVARQFGLREAGPQSAAEQLVALLRHARLLLVLDNFEHVRVAAPQVSALLSACPHLAALVTSRALLHVAGERIVQVSPLALPAQSPCDPRWDPDPPPTAVAASPAVQLFVDRAQTGDPAFALDARNAAAVAAICRRLDGLPLAIELAAARMRLLSPGELLARLDRTLQLLTGGPADAPDRQRTMRGTIAWSYGQLDPTAQSLIRRLAVFVGGFTLESAEFVGGDGFALGGDAVLRTEDRGVALPSSSSAPRPAGRPPLSEASPPEPKATPPRAARLSPPSVLDALTTLLDDSLLRRTPQSDGDARFVMLETVREYALEQLAARGEATAARDAHAAWCLALAEQAEPELLAAGRAAWIECLALELPNLRAALTWCSERGDTARALRLAGAIGMFWTDPHYLREGRSWLEEVVALPRAAGAPALLATVLNAIGVVAQWQGDFARVAEVLEAALLIRRELGDQLGVAEVVGNLGHLALSQGELDRAAMLLAESLPAYERAGRAVWVGETQMLLGHTACAGADYEGAAAYHEAAVNTLRGLPGQCKLDDGLLNLGWAHLLRGKLAPSAAAYREGLALVRGRHDEMRLGRCVRGAAGLAAASGDARRAARLFAAAAAQRVREEIPLQPVIQADHDRLLAGVRHALDDEAFAAAWAAGASLPLEDAVTEAAVVLDFLDGNGVLDAPVAADRDSATTNLTPREQDVLRLLVAGRSDKEIAAALFISRRTASSHVAAILSKLHVDSRTAAVSVAIRGGFAGERG